MTKYANLKNVQILIALLKEHGIRKIIASPGAMNITFTGSIQDDEFFEIYSCVDERSAAYMAYGLAQESGEPVALTCTGATASRNYMPGLTEAYYNQVPVLAITATQHLGKIGHHIPQVIDRSTTLNDIVKKSVQVPSVHTSEDEWACNTAINDALLELTHNGGGPVHIDIVTSFDAEFNTKKLPTVRKINRITLGDTFPNIQDKKIGIFIGNHPPVKQPLQQLIEEFCEKYDAVVLCDATSNYYGKYKVLGNIICDQDNYDSPAKKFDIIIHLGNISGSYMRFSTQKVYRVNTDGAVRDTFQKLTNVFQMSEEQFFQQYNTLVSERKATKQYKTCENEILDITSHCDYDKIPFSNIWIASKLAATIPEKSYVHLGILNSLRSWNYSCEPKELYISSNTGGFGIDGPLSTTLGSSLCHKDAIHYCILGDLAFFYDMNALGNRYLGNNLRIILINNGCGTEFHHYNHYAHAVGKDKIGKFIAADGHFGNQSNKLVSDYAQDLGFDYYSAHNKQEFLKLNKIISDPKIGKHPILLEIFTDPEEESAALKCIRNLKTSATDAAKHNIKKTAKKILPSETISIMKKIITK